MKRKCKIIHVLESGDLSGSGGVVRRIANALDPERFDVCVIYAVRAGCSPQQFESLFSKNVRCVYLPSMVRPPSPTRDFRALVDLWRLLKSEKPGVVHFHSSKAGFLGRLAALFLPIPAVYYSSHGYGFRMRDCGLLARCFYWLLEFSVSKIGIIIVNAPNEMHWAKIFAWPRNPIACFNAIDVNAFEPKYNGANGRVLAVACGRITYARNPDAFLRLVRAATEKDPSLDFLWVGGSADRETEEFQRKAASLPEGRFRLSGWVDKAEMTHLVGQGDLFVHYSLWDVCPTAVTEAMALGKPVVGSVAVDQLEHRVNGYAARDEKELLGYVLELASNHPLRVEMGRASRKIAEEKFNFKPYIQRLEAIYLGKELDGCSGCKTLGVRC
jgi:glycosyltransferase involved in cell wall biosynthesis